jgi:hypothetical protein
MSLAVQQAVSARATALADIDGLRDRRPAPRADVAPGRAAPNSRHALLGALADVLASSAPASTASSPAADERAGGGEHASTQALHAFVHALFAELRPTDGQGSHGRGFAWGRTTAATLGQRLEDAVARLRGGDDDAAATSPPASTATESPLLTAFRELATARGAGGDEAATANALVAVLQRVASALGGDAEALAPAPGSVLDVTA